MPYANTYAKHTKYTFLLPSRLYCRFRNRTESCAEALADFTADREFHPALKNFIFIYYPIIIRKPPKFKAFLAFLKMAVFPRKLHILV